MISMEYLAALIYSLVMIAMCTCVQAAPSDCRVTYYNFLQSAANLKKKCSGAGLKDCCQVCNNIEVSLL